MASLDVMKSRYIVMTGFPLAPHFGSPCGNSTTMCAEDTDQIIVAHVADAPSHASPRQEEQWSATSASILWTAEFDRCAVHSSVVLGQLANKTAKGAIAVL